MPITFSQIQQDKAIVTVSTNAGPVVIAYYPNKLTSKMIDALNKGDVGDTALFEELIASWDIYEDEHHRVMFPVARIEELGIFFKTRIAQAMIEHMRPEAPTAQANI